jgi:AcrR family transcriptional regulator
MHSSAEARVLDAAYNLYVSEGMGALSMRRVALAIGNTAPALYKHFDSKDALIEAIAERGFEVFDSRLIKIANTGRALRRIVRILQCYRDFAIDEPQLFEIMFVVPRARRRRFPDDFAARRSTSFNMLHSAVEQAMQEKRIRKDDALELTLNLWAFAHGLVGLHRAGRFDTNVAAFRRLFDRAIDRLFSGLAAK